MPRRIEESFNFYSHLAGVVAAVVGVVFLGLVASYSASALVTAMIYGGSVVFLFAASSLYHALKREENEWTFWRKMDRVAIFCMIAGTYTPICYIYLDGPWRWAMIALQMGVVGSVFFPSSFFRACPGSCTPHLLAMGWMAIVPIRQMLAAHDPRPGGAAFLPEGCLSPWAASSTPSKNPGSSPVSSASTSCFTSWCFWAAGCTMP
jgi:hemolysin III